MENNFCAMLQMVSEQFKQLTTEARKYILEPQKFDQHVNAFFQGVTSTLSIFASPAICIIPIPEDGDIQKCKVAAGGEKWKFLLAMTRMSEIDANNADTGVFAANTIVFTNPITLKVDETLLSRADILTIMNNYEDINDSLIKIIMDINATAMTFSMGKSNSDRADAMVKCLESIDKGIEIMHEYYGYKPEKNIQNMIH